MFIVRNARSTILATTVTVKLLPTVPRSFLSATPEGRRRLPSGIPWSLVISTVSIFRCLANT
eukprot:8164244-Lingulodinium_polyedra.AAC.1